MKHTRVLKGVGVRALPLTLYSYKALTLETPSKILNKDFLIEIFTILIKQLKVVAK